MIQVLDTTSELLRIKAIADIHWTAAWADATEASLVEGSSSGISNGTTDDTLVASPAASTRRIIKSISLHNAHATTTRVVTLVFFDGTAERIIGKITLPAGLTWYSSDPVNVAGGIVLTDGDKGDVTVSSSGQTWTINPKAVTYSKIQDVPADRLLGRQTGSTGTVEEIVCTPAGRALIDDADAAAQRTTLGLGSLATQSGTFSGTSSGTNTGDQNTFSTVAVSQDGGTATGSPAVADTASDTLTLVAGANITLDATAGTDSIKITSTAAGVTNGDKGDVTVTNAGTGSEAWTIDNGAVTPAKLSAAAQALSFRNLLINGDMSVTQRVQSGGRNTVTVATTSASTSAAITIPANSLVTRVSMVMGGTSTSPTSAMTGVTSGSTLQFGTTASGETALFGSTIFTSGNVGTTYSVNTLTLVSASRTVQVTFAANPTSSNLVTVAVDYLSPVTGIIESGYYSADRWNTQIGNTVGTWTQSIEPDGPGGQGFPRSLKMVCTASNSSLDAADQLVIQQRLEGQNVQGLLKGTSSAQPVTVSFWVKSGTTGTYIAELQDNDNTRFASQAYTISSANQWVQQKLTFPADTSGVLSNGVGYSLSINFWLVAGSNFTNGSLQSGWQTTTANRAAGQVQTLSTANAAGTNYWQITGVQLEIGATPTEFERIPPGMTYERCKPYFYLYVNHIQSPIVGQHTSLFSGYYATGTQAETIFVFPFQFRVAPTFFCTPTPVTVPATIPYFYFFCNNASDDLSVIRGFQATRNNILLANETDASGPTGNSGRFFIRYDAPTGVRLTFDAEL